MKSTHDPASKRSRLRELEAMLKHHNPKLHGPREPLIQERDALQRELSGASEENHKAGQQRSDPNTFTTLSGLPPALKQELGRGRMEGGSGPSGQVSQRAHWKFEHKPPAKAEPGEEEQP